MQIDPFHHCKRRKDRTRTQILLTNWILEAISMAKIYRPDHAFAQAFLLQLAVVLLGACKVILPIMIEYLDRIGAEQAEVSKTPWVATGRALLVLEVVAASLLSCALALD